MAAAGALLVGGTALAAGGGGFLGGGPGERDAELAQDLAKKLDGVSSSEVREALGEIRNERRTARRNEMAAAIAAELDGVGQADVERALAKLEANRPSLRNGPPSAAERRRFRRQGGFAGQLARELGKSRAEVRQALRAARKKHFEAKLAEAVKDGRLTQEQADAIEKRFESGERMFRRGRFHGGPGGPGGHGPGGHGPGGPGGFGFGGPPPEGAPGG